MDEQHGREAIDAFKAWVDETHSADPHLAEAMGRSFERFVKWATDVVAEDPEARFALVECQPLAAHARPSQQHVQELERQGYNVALVSGEKGVRFARQHLMPNSYVAGPDWLAPQEAQDALLRVRAQEGNDAFCEKLYPEFASEQAKAMVPGASRIIEFLGDRLDVIGGDVSSGAAALLQERYGEQFGIKRFAVDNGLGPGYEEYGGQTNEALNDARREVGLPEQPVGPVSVTCTGEGGVLTPFVPGVLYKNGGQDLELHGFQYVDPKRVGETRTRETPVFPGAGERPLFYGTGTSSGGQSAEVAELLHDHNMAMIRAGQRLAEERGAQTLIAVGTGKIAEFAHLAVEPGITVVTEGGTPGFQGTEPGVTLVEFADQIAAYHEIAQNIADGQGGGVVSHGGAGTIKEATSAALPAPMEVMGFPTFADQQYNIRAMAERGVFLEVTGDTVDEWTDSIYANAVEMLDNPGARQEATLQLREELDSLPSLGETYQEFLGGPSAGPHRAPADGPAPRGGPSGGGAIAPDTVPPLPQPIEDPVAPEPVVRPVTPEPKPEPEPEPEPADDPLVPEPKPEPERIDDPVDPEPTDDPVKPDPTDGLPTVETQNPAVETQNTAVETPVAVPVPTGIVESNIEEVVPARPEPAAAEPADEPGPVLHLDDELEAFDDF